MIIEFFHEAREQIENLLESAKENGYITEYSIDVNFDDYKIDINVKPIGSNKFITFKYVFERINKDDKSGNDKSSK